MSWNYSGNPKTSPKDYVRFLLGDTDSTWPLLTDEEIQFLLDNRGDNVYAAVVDALDQLIARFSREVDYKIGPEQVQASQRVKQFIRLQTRLRAQLIGQSAAPSWNDISLREGIFDIGMHDNKGSGW